MESFSGDTEDSTEDISGRKKPKLKSLKTRLFGKSKKAGEEGNRKLSQSTSDITAGQTLGSDEDLLCSQGMMGSRALSHDSIFLADQVMKNEEPDRVFCQENVHSKIKALQEKLQQQKLHLGLPPSVLPMKRPEDVGRSSEDEVLPQSPPETAGGHIANQGALTKVISQLGPHPLPPIPKPAPSRTVSPTVPVPSSSSSPPVVEQPLDFSSPAQFTSCLDTSAARHRMSVKPKHQRASTKRRLPGSDSGSLLHNVNNAESLREEQPDEAQKEETMGTETGGADILITSQCLPSKCPEPIGTPSETTKAETAPKSTSLTFSQPDSALPGKVSSQVLRNKPHRSVDVIRPHSSYIQTDMMEKTQGPGESETQTVTSDKGGKADMKTKIDQFSTSSGSAVIFRSSGVQGEAETTRGIKRPAPGSGSFHFSISTARNRDEERPRSGSFLGVLEHAEAQLKTGDGKDDMSPSNMREKEEFKDLKPRGGHTDMGRLKQEGALHKILVFPWDRDSLKKVESVTQSKNIATDRGNEELESSQEAMEEAVEAKEDQGEDGKMAFGVKLRATSQSVRLRSEASSYQHSKSTPNEEQREKQQGQQISSNANFMSKKQPVNISEDVKPSDGSTAPSGVCFPVKHIPQSTGTSHTIPTEVKTTSSNPSKVETAPQVSQEPQPAPQTTSSEVSWMSLAMEKTKSLQSLFTSRFPRDFPGMQTAARPQTQAQTTNQAQMETQSTKSTTPMPAASQPPSDTMKSEIFQTKTQAQTVKQSALTATMKIPKMAPSDSNTSKEPQKQTEPQLQPNTPVTQCVTHPTTHTNLWMTQSPLRSYQQTESAPQPVQPDVYSGTSQQAPWSNRGPTQGKSMTSASAAHFSPCQVAASGSEEGAADVPGRRTAWGGAISQKAAFLERRAEWTTPPGIKGVETSAQTTPPLSKDIKPEGNQWVKHAESSPTKVPDRSREDRWLRKTMASSSSPSSSPTLPSALSDSSQPSWMELAKRKSMAWSDKTMD